MKAIDLGSVSAGFGFLKLGVAKGECVVVHIFEWSFISIKKLHLVMHQLLEFLIVTLCSVVSVGAKAEQITW